MTDDRITCRQCVNLYRNGQCKAAQVGTLALTSRRYFPLPDTPRRCEGFIPQGQEPDQRNGLARWPGLNHPGMKTLSHWKPKDDNPSQTRP